MRKIFRASVLVLALCVPAFAGDIPMPPAPQPAPLIQTPKEPSADGNERTEEEGGLTETMLSMIESLIALF